MPSAPVELPIVAEVLRLFRERGSSMYGGEGVTQLEHGLQAAMFAEQEGASSELVAAALLHDVGHLLHDLPDDAPDNGIDDVHEELGARWLRERFPSEVLEPVRLHVAAKRYLCGAEPEYERSLSEPSRVSLALQGGPMSAEECDAFRRDAHFEAAVRLRRWDDLAKVIDLATPPLGHFATHLARVALA
jgi:phosphonate degradation associated HDIG domain protein